MRMSLVQHFTTKFNAKFPVAPDETGKDKTDVYREFTFKATYKLFPQTDDLTETLKELQAGKGTKGFLDEVLIECECLTPKDVEFSGDSEDETLTCVEWVRRHLIAQQAALTAFWDVVNKGMEEKNSKKSRAR